MACHHVGSGLGCATKREINGVTKRLINIIMSEYSYYISKSIQAFDTLREARVFIRYRIKSGHYNHLYRDNEGKFYINRISDSGKVKRFYL